MLQLVYEFGRSYNLIVVDQRILGIGSGSITDADRHGTKRRLVDPGNREAALLTRRALRQRGSKVGIRARHQAMSGAGDKAATSLRDCSVVPVTGKAGAQ